MLELGACLTLVGSTSMPQDTRSEWLKVAHHTLRDLPADLLARGCAKARQTCRFPSEVVPAILAEVGTAMALRKGRVKVEPISYAPPQRIERQDYVDPAEITKLLKSLGAN